MGIKLSTRDPRSLTCEPRSRHGSCVLLHPGTCDSDLSRPWHNNVLEGKLFSKERGVRQLLDIIEGARIEDSGTLIAWDGSVIEW